MEVTQSAQRGCLESHLSHDLVSVMVLQSSGKARRHFTKYKIQAPDHSDLKRKGGPGDALAEDPWFRQNAFLLGATS